MGRAHAPRNTVGNVWTTWGAVGAAAACLGVSWRQQRWLPPATLGAALLADHFATGRLHSTIARPGPPPNPLGTYPAGGPDRIVLFSGLIAYLLWREFSGSRRGMATAYGAVAALAFSQAYCRQYLSQHWFIDIICGLRLWRLAARPVHRRGTADRGPGCRATTAGDTAGPRRCLQGWPIAGSCRMTCVAGSGPAARDLLPERLDRAAQNREPHGPPAVRARTTIPPSRSVTSPMTRNDNLENEFPQMHLCHTRPTASH